MKAIKVFAMCICIALSSSMVSNAQNGAYLFDLGSQRINLGAGLANISTGSIIVPPIYASYERGTFCVGNMIIGLGASGECSKTRDIPGHPKYDNNSISVEAFGKLHIPISEDFEASGYVGIGYGSYGSGVAKINSVCRSIGIEGLYRFSSGLAAFVNLETSSLPGKAGIRVGISFAL